MSWTAEIETAFGSPPEQGYGPPTVDVAAASWAESLLAARDGLGCRFFDFLTAVDLLEEGFSVVAHIAARQVGNVASVMLRTRLPRDEPRLDCVCGVYAGAGWHERETAEMFGIDFLDASGARLELAGLLLPPGFEGHPLRKDQLLSARVERPWPGAKEPGESDADVRPSRRRLRPPGVPAPERGASR